MYQRAECEARVVVGEIYGRYRRDIREIWEGKGIYRADIGEM